VVALPRNNMDVVVSIELRHKLLTNLSIDVIALGIQKDHVSVFDRTVISGSTMPLSARQVYAREAVPASGTRRYTTLHIECAETQRTFSIFCDLPQPRSSSEKETNHHLYGLKEDTQQADVARNV